MEGSAQALFEAAFQHSGCLVSAVDVMDYGLQLVIRFGLGQVLAQGWEMLGPLH